ncbi:MAG: ferredoxin--NADP reductase [Planctomycetes bacterium]|nr:ferredoxin--NADP reductase [Planctomycetota bacterium]
MTESTLSAILLERRDVAPSLAIFRFRAEAPLEFLPGQFAVLGINGIERAYSIASAPGDDLEFFIELVPQGRLTPLIFALKAGDIISLRPHARGRFLLDPAAANHLMVATVTGVAPFMSMLRAAPGAKFFLIHGASHVAEFGYADELRQLAARNLMRYLPTVSRPFDAAQGGPAENAGWTGATGRAESHIEGCLDTWGLSAANTTAYLCGHPGMVANARQILARAGFQPQRLRSESW